MPFEVALLDTSPPPLYQRIARKALHLQQLGLSLSAIARRLGVTGKTVTKGIAWIRHIPSDSERGQHIGSWRVLLDPQAVAEP
jgi:hypothetical protein